MDPRYYMLSLPSARRRLSSGSPTLPRSGRSLRRSSQHPNAISAMHCASSTGQSGTAGLSMSKMASCSSAHPTWCVNPMGGLAMMICSSMMSSEYRSDFDLEQNVPVLDIIWCCITVSTTDDGMRRASPTLVTLLPCYGRAGCCRLEVTVHERLWLGVVCTHNGININISTITLDQEH
jgi:hypothetical protein